MWIVPNEIEYVDDLVMGSVRVRVRFSTDGSSVVSFMVQLETIHGHEWKPVQRYDDYHGRPHRDFLDRWGHEYRKEWLDVDRKTALTMAIQDFKDHWKLYVAAFLEDEAHE